MTCSKSEVLYLNSRMEKVMVRAKMPGQDFVTAFTNGKSKDDYVVYRGRGQ